MHISLRALFEPLGATPPLFDTQRELAQALCAYRGVGKNKLTSTAAFLSMIMTGRRPIPRDWKEDLKVIVGRRATERGLDAARLATLLAIIECASPRGEQHPLNGLLMAQAAARDTLILNARPLELSDAKSEHAEAAELQRLVLASLEDGRRYHYGVASYASARRLWHALLLAADETHKAKAAEKMRDWAERGLLTVSVVPELLLLQPTVAYNTSAPDRLEVFVWHAPYDWEHTLAIPTQQTAAWLGKVQNALDTQSDSVPYMP